MNGNSNSSHSQQMSQASTPQQQYPQGQYQGQPMFQSMEQMGMPMQQGMPMMQPNMNQQQPQQQFFNQQDQPQQPQQQQQPMSELMIVKQMIEQYLQFYFSYDQIMTELEKKGIPQNYTKIVLDSLISQNRNYFLAYEVRICLNEQIERFNKFIAHHFQLAAQSMDMNPQNQPQPLQFSSNDMPLDFTMGSGFLNNTFNNNDQNMGM